MNLSTDMSKMHFLYQDGGDQEGRLTSIELPMLVVPYNEHAMDIVRDAEYPDPMLGASAILIVDRVITVSSQPWDEDNLDRDEVVESVGIVNSFKFNDSNTTEQLGYTVVMTNTVDPEDDTMFIVKVWYTKLSYPDVLKYLGGYASEGYDPDNYVDLLQSNNDFLSMENIWFYDNLNSEWIETT